MNNRDRRYDEERRREFEGQDRPRRPHRFDERQREERPPRPPKPPRGMRPHHGMRKGKLTTKMFVTKEELVEYVNEVGEKNVKIEVFKIDEGLYKVEVKEHEPEIRKMEVEL